LAERASLRKKSERREATDSLPVYGEGYGKPRKLTLGCGTITVHRSRVRGLEERFAPADTAESVSSMEDEI